MVDFTKTERNVENMFPKGSSFSLEGEDYKVLLSGKPRPSTGECKTDVYILGKTRNGKEKEVKISVKQKNADFLENKMSLNRGREIFGENASCIIKQCLLSIKNCFSDDYLVYFEKKGKTKAHTMKLGWKFELLNKPSGEKSGFLKLTDEQKRDVFAGTNLPENKRNSRVNGQIINESGVANYILNIDDDNISQETCLRNLRPIDEYAKSQNIYFACKALNYRFDENKWDGARPLSVYVNWCIENKQLNAHLIFDHPLECNGNQIGNNLKTILEKLSIKKFDDLKEVLSPTVKCFFKK